MIGIGFGTWAWGNQLLWGYRPEKDDLILENTFKKAVSGGLSLVDTADSYGTGFLNGRSEILLGNFIEKLPYDKRKSLNIATKLAPFPWRIGNKGFQKAFLSSQRRLKGNINRVQLHWSTSRYAPWQEMPLIDNLIFLVQNGYVQEIGLSNVGPERLKHIYQHLKSSGVKLKSLQMQFSLLSSGNTSGNQKQLRELCKELEIELIAYSPLAFGVLCVPPNCKKLPSTLLRRRIFHRLLPGSNLLRQALQEIALERKASQSQVALNWCRAHGAMPIPGLRTPQQAEDTVSALNWTLSNAEREQLDSISEECKERMPNNPFQSK